MTIGTREHAALADDAYNNRSEDVGKEKAVTVDGVQYKILAAAGSPSGYQGTAYQRIDTGEVVIAHRGTESVKDGVTDAGMAVAGRSNQLGDAMAFTQRVVDEAKRSAELRHQTLNVTIAGHSLGGTLAEITAAKYGLPAETFNAYGPASLKNLKDFGVDANGRYPNIVNHVRATDVVGAGSPHLGEVRTYAAPQDIESLRRGRYLESGLLHLPTNPLLTADLSAHKMGNFLPHNDLTGASIITPVNEARARAYHGAIEHYRQDVVLARIDLTKVANRAPSPLHALNPLDPSVKLRAQALDAGTVMTASLAIDGLVQDAQMAGEGVSRAYGSLFDNKPATPTASPSLDHPTHPDHALFRQAQTGVHSLDVQNGRAPDQRSDNLAAALVVAARKDGMSRIDHVSLSTDASKVFAMQGALNSPFKQITSVPTTESLDTPFARSVQALDRAMHQSPSEQRRRPRLQQPEPPQANGNAGPARAM